MRSKELLDPNHRNSSMLDFAAGSVLLLLDLADIEGRPTV